MADKGRAERERALLEELRGVAHSVGIRVRQERLLREVGYRVRSGVCRVRDTSLVLLDRDLPVSAQIDILADVLAERVLEEVYVSPAVRQLLDKRSESPTGTGE